MIEELEQLNNELEEKNEKLLIELEETKKKLELKENVLNELRKKLSLSKARSTYQQKYVNFSRGYYDTILDLLGSDEE